MTEIRPRVADLLRRIERHVIDTPHDDATAAAQDAEWESLTDDEKAEFADHSSWDGEIITKEELFRRWESD